MGIVGTIYGIVVDYYGMIGNRIMGNAISNRSINMEHYGCIYRDIVIIGIMAKTVDALDGKANIVIPGS
jgi:hypothetical protein